MTGPGRPLAETRNHLNHEPLKNVLQANVPILEHTTPFGKGCPCPTGSLYQTILKHETLVCDICKKRDLFRESAHDTPSL